MNTNLKLILDLMKDSGKYVDDSINMTNEIYKFCAEIDNEEGKNICEKRGIPFAEVQKLSDEYVQNCINKLKCLEGYRSYHNDIIKAMIKSGSLEMDEIGEKAKLINIIREYCYKLSLECCFREDNMERYFNFYGVNVEKRYIISSALKYQRSFVNIHHALFEYNDNDFNPDQRIVINIPAKIEIKLPLYVEAFDKILKTSNEQEMIEIVTKYFGFSYSQRETTYSKMEDYFKIRGYDSVNCEKDKAKIHRAFDLYENNLKEKIDAEKITKQAERKAKLQEERIAKMKASLPEAQQTITRFLENDEQTIEEFCLENDFSKDEFRKYVSIIKEFDKNLYKKYENRKIDKQSEKFTVLLGKIEQVIKWIRNGIEEKGEVREFNVVDYYLYTNLSFENLVKIASNNKKLSKGDLIALKRWINKNKGNSDFLKPNDLKYLLTDLYNNTMLVGVKFDKNREKIPGTGREITKEEKQKVISYLYLHKVPVTYTTFNIVLKRWLAGNLDLDSDQPQNNDQLQNNDQPLRPR